MNNRYNLLLEMLSSQPDDAFLLYALALEEMKLGNINLAVSQLESLKNKQPNYLPTYYQLGKWLEQLNNLSEAINNYKAGIKLAEQLGDKKALKELKEALFFVDEDEDF